MNNNTKIVDNFLDQEYFDSLVSFFIENQGKEGGPSWNMQQNIEGNFDHLTADTTKLIAFVHFLYANTIAIVPHVNEKDINEKEFFGIGQPCSPYFRGLLPILEKLNIKSLIRVKANLYPYSGETLHEHEMHIDYDFPHYSAILSLNTCDGYTKLEDGTKVESIANRMLIFDGNQKHCSTTTTSKFARINININYL